MNQWTPKGQKQIDPHESLTTEERAYPEELFSASWVPNQCGESLTRWSKVSNHTPSIYNSFTIHLPFIYHSFTIDSTNPRGALRTPSLIILWYQFISLISWLRLHISSLKKKYEYTWWKNTEWYLMDSILHKPNMHHNVLVCLIFKCHCQRFLFQHRLERGLLFRREAFHWRGGDWTARQSLFLTSSDWPWIFDPSASNLFFMSGAWILLCSLRASASLSTSASALQSLIVR